MTQLRRLRLKPTDTFVIDDLVFPAQVFLQSTKPNLGTTSTAPIFPQEK